MEPAVVRKGKDCVALVNTALAEINAGHVDKASQQLGSLKEDGTELAAQAEALAARLEKVAEHYIRQGEDIQRKIGEYGLRENDLQRQKSGAESNLACQHSALESKQSQLSQAERELSSAESRRREKEKEAENIQAGAVVGGIVLGIFTFGIGAAAGAATGAAAGAAVGKLINELKDEERKADRAVQRCRSECREAQESIRSCEQSISSIRSNISQLSAQIQHMKQQRLKYSEDAGKLKEAIVFLRESVQFWLLFKQASDHGVVRTKVLQRIAENAKKKADLQILQMDATKRVAATFLEAWEAVETMAVEGGSKHFLQIEFKCSSCNSDHTALPYVKDGSFICATCYSRLAIV